MKIDKNRIHVVYTPTPISELGDIYTGAASIENLYLQFKGGLEPERIHAMYSTKEEAEKEAKRLFEIVRDADAKIQNSEIMKPKPTKKIDKETALRWFYEAQEKVELLEDLVEAAEDAKDNKNLNKHLSAALENLEQVGYFLKVDFG